MEENKSECSGIDRSQFYDLYKEMQNEIKDKVITKQLLLISHQAKEITELKKENILLKNQLTYILKKILLNKNDYTSAARTNRLNNLNSSINYNRSMILKDNNRKSNSMLRPLRSCENYRCVTENITSRYKENNNSLVNIHGNENNNNSSIDNKVSGYLNSLYRHNFNNTNKAGGNNFLNKNQTLMEELFPNKNSSFYINSENDQLIDNDGLGNKNKTNKKRENNSSERRSSFKKNNIRNYGVKTNSTSKRYKSKYIDANNSTKKRNKDNNYLDTNEKNKYNTINNATRKNNKNKRPILYSKRSPFLANKY
jgi:hypothetical protein